MTYVALPCVDTKDRAWIAQCPADCIREGRGMFYIYPEDYVDCGTDVPVCPGGASFYEGDLPPQEQRFYDVDVRYFDGPSSRFGATGQGPLDREHLLVTTRFARGEHS